MSSSQTEVANLTLLRPEGVKFFFCLFLDLARTIIIFTANKRHTYIFNCLTYVLEFLSLIKIDFFLFNSSKQVVPSFSSESISLADHLLSHISEVTLSFFEIFRREDDLVTASCKKLFALVLQVQKLNFVNEVRKIVKNFKIVLIFFQFLF